jgi:hypothetical protein
MFNFLYRRISLVGQTHVSFLFPVIAHLYPGNSSISGSTRLGKVGVPPLDKMGPEP